MAERGASNAVQRNRIQLEDVKQTITCGICLQLFTDPRSLSCSHSYCLVCLQGFQKSTRRKECPVCRSNSIPSKHDLDNLPANKLAIDLVKLVHSYEPSAVEEGPEWKKANNKKKDAADDDDSSSSDSDSSDSDSSDMSLGDRLQRLLSLTDNLNVLQDLLADISLAQSDSDDSDDNGPRHMGICCDGCHKSRFRGARYRCGQCDDFDLCSKCEKKPRSEVHPTDEPHVFIKLKKPSTRAYPQHPVLREDALVMAMTMDVTKTDHVLHLSDTESKTICCDNCGVSPIKGIRYKCGVCGDYDLCSDCEEFSETFHDENHPFLVFKHPVSYHTTIPQLSYNFY